jgi:hypothetical protein
MDEQDIDGVALVARAGTAGLVALIASADPGSGFLAAAMLPALDAGIERVRQFRRAACGFTIQIAAESVAMSPEDLVERLTATPAKVQLLACALEAASETAWQSKMRVLGRALASGALEEDDAKVMEELGWEQIVRKLEAPHLRIVAYLCKEDPEYRGQGYLIAAKRYELKTLSGFDQLIGPVLVAMEQDNLIHSTDGGEYDTHFRARWGLTAGTSNIAYVHGELARPCLERFRLAGVGF